ASEEVERNLFGEFAIELFALLQELDRAVFREKLARRGRAIELLHDLIEGRLADRIDFDFLVAADFRDRLFEDLLRAFIRFGAFASEDLGVDDRSVHARRNAEGSVTHVAGYFAEDRAKEFLFRSKVGLAFRRHLTDQDAARLDFRPEPNDAGLVEVLQGLFADVRNIAIYVFLPELRIAGDVFEFFDVDRSGSVFHD